MWPQVPVRTKAIVAPYVLLALVVSFILDDAGIINLPIQPPSATPAQAAEATPGGRPSARPSRAARADIPRRYLALYQRAGRRSGVPWPVLAAVGKVESDHGKHMGPSSAGALGPMQFMPGTWATWGRGGNVYDPADAIPAASRFLRALGAQRRLSWALAAYNAGPGRADHPPASTRQYVKNVRAIAHRYQRRPR
jgi:soluble lytic murein transglycosylase-like protein